MGQEANININWFSAFSRGYHCLHTLSSRKSLFLTHFILEFSRSWGYTVHYVEQG